MIKILLAAMILVCPTDIITPDPSHPNVPPKGATAMCGDGNWTDQTGAGTCTDHGGVKAWLTPPKS